MPVKITVSIGNFSGRKWVLKKWIVKMNPTASSASSLWTIVAMLSSQPGRSRVKNVGNHRSSPVARDPRLMLESPYDRGWACLLRPSDLIAELPSLRIGKPVISWYQDEVVRLRGEAARAGNGVCPWPVLEAQFLRVDTPTSEKAMEGASR